MTTPTKRCHDELPELKSQEALQITLRSAVATYESAEIAVLHLIRQYRFDRRMLQDALDEEDLNVSFSKVRYKSVANFVGLDALHQFADAPTFKLYRSHLPTTLFGRILEDINDMIMQYGPPAEHKTEAATSRFFSPIFNRLVPLFHYVFRNIPDPVIEGHMTTSGRIGHYFDTCGFITILIIEAKLGIEADRLDVVAQVIAECDACNWRNSQFTPYPVPVFGVFCDGSTFEFFKFQEDSQLYSFSRGCLPSDPRTFQNGHPLSDLSLNPTLFIMDLRIICEILFDIMMQAFISSIVGFRDQLIISLGRTKDLTIWEEALQLAHAAVAKFRQANDSRSDGAIADANSTAQEGLDALTSSCAILPPLHHRVSIIDAWDEEEIERV